MSRGRSNNLRARRYFGIVGQSDMILHHKDVNMKYENPDRYYQWNPEDLVVMTKGDHQRYHISLKNPFWQHPESTKKKMSENHADVNGSKNPRARKVIELNSGKVFDCINDACEKFNLSRSNIYLSIKANIALKRSATQWRYYNG